MSGAEAAIDLKNELPTMRVLQRPPLPPVFLLEAEEIGWVQPLPSVPELHFAMFVDDRLRVHFEINHVINRFDRPRLKDLWNPMKHYRAIAPTLIEHSFLKNHRRLIGGLAATFTLRDRCTLIRVIGILPQEELRNISKEVRKKAFLLLGEKVDEFNRWIGADFVRSGYTVIPAERMIQAGWEIYRLKKWKNILRFYRESFPLWLRRHQKFFIRRYQKDAVIEKE